MQTVVIQEGIRSDMASRWKRWRSRVKVDKQLMYELKVMVRADVEFHRGPYAMPKRIDNDSILSLAADAVRANTEFVENNMRRAHNVQR